MDAILAARAIHRNLNYWSGMDDYQFARDTNFFGEIKTIKNFCDFEKEELEKAEKEERRLVRLNMPKKVRFEVDDEKKHGLLND